MPSWSVKDLVVLTAFEWFLIAVAIHLTKFQNNTLKGGTYGQILGKTCIQTSNPSPLNANIIKTGNFGCFGVSGALLSMLP